MRTILLAIATIASVFSASFLSAQATYSADFENPPFSLGDIDHQDGWGYLSNSPTGGWIAVAPSGSSDVGAQSLRLETRNKDNFFVANNVFSPTISPAAGETGSTAVDPVVNPKSRFVASLWYRTPDVAPTSDSSDGRFAELDPSSRGTDDLSQSDPRRPANRYVVVRMTISGGQPRAVLRWPLGNLSFTGATIANLAWGTWYRIEYVVDLVDGLNGIEPNDRVKITMRNANGSLLGTACGSTWETGYKSGTYGGGTTPRAINGFDFWSLANTNGMVVGYIDNLTMTTSDTPSAPQVTITGNNQACAGGTTTLTAQPTGGSGSFTTYVWRDSANTVVGNAATFAAPAGSYTVTVTDSDCVSATSASVTVSEYPTLSATITGNTSVCYGATTTLTANTSGGSGAISSYEWRDAANAIVGTASTLTAGAGTYTVTVTDATCGPVTSSPTTVQTTCKATPTLSWNTPADIVYGTLLSGTQLNATADVPGTFVYTPPAGTRLNAGNGQVLSVEFTPTDTTNYNNASATVLINVAKSPTVLTITSAKPNPSQSGENVVVRFTLTGIFGTPGGLVTITDGVQSCTAAPEAIGACTLALTTLGTRSITATYSGDSNHLASTAPAVAHRVYAVATAKLDGSGAVCPGGSATLRVLLDGRGPWTIRWSDGVVETTSDATYLRTVSPATTTTYTLTSVSDVNGAGTTSGSATITVNVTPPPAIVDPPSAQLGQPVTLHATPGYDAYQWFRDGIALAGQTSATLAIPSIDLASYTVTGTRNGCVSAASAAYSLQSLGLPSDYQAIIAVVGNAPGVGGSRFRTAVYLVNETDEEADGDIRFIDPAVPAVPFHLGAHETRFLETILPASYAALTSANVRALHGPLPIVIAHVFNDGGLLGTAGLIERAVPVIETLTVGDRVVLATPIDPVTTRMNIGIRSLADGITVRVTRRDQQGLLLSTLVRTVPPSTLIHQSAVEFLGATPGSSESLTFDVLAGRGVVYGAATDNGTNDPNLQLTPRLPESSPGGRFILPIAGRTSGQFNSHFATALQIHNPTAEPLAAVLTLHPAGIAGSASDPTSAVTILPGATVAMDDLTTRFIPQIAGLGSLDIATPPSQRPMMLARFYNSAPEGRTSLTTDLVAEEDVLTQNEKGVLAAPHAPQNLRFNIGVRTLSLGAKMTAVVRSRTGTILRSVPLTFAPTYFIHTSAEALLGVPFTGDESIAFTIDEGSAVIYGVWTDNATQDPAIQYAVRTP